MKNKNLQQGIYTPENPSKYLGDPSNIVFRSGWERIYFIKCDRNTNIVAWASEELIIPYYSTVDKRARRYFPDVLLHVRKEDGSIEKTLVEIKPYKETIKPVMPKRMTKKTRARMLEEHITYQRNMDKWEAASKYCAKHGMRFGLVTEYELGLKKR